MKLPLPTRFIRLCTTTSEGYAEVGARQVYIFPTGYGFLFALLLCLMLIGSINYSNNLGFLLTFLLAGLGMVAMIHTWRNLVGLQLSCTAPKATFKGKQAHYPLIVRNNRSYERPAIKIEFRSSESAECDLDRSTSQQLPLNVKATERGLQQIPRITASTQYPLGLFTAWTYMQLENSALVYPAPGPTLKLDQQPSYKQSRQGNKGVGAEDFVGQRDYHAGDSPKHINWKAFAREQGLQTKQFGGDRAEQLWLDWDKINENDIELKLSRLCKGVLDAANRNLEYGLRLPDLEISPALDMAHKQHCLSALALYGKTP